MAAVIHKRNWHPQRPSQVQVRSRNTRKPPENHNPPSRLIIGKPDCGTVQPWSIYQYLNSSDRLKLLPSGVLRHYSEHPAPGEEMLSDLDSKSFHYDYPPGKYCLDTVFTLSTTKLANRFNKFSNYRNTKMAKRSNSPAFVPPTTHRNGSQRPTF